MITNATLISYTTPAEATSRGGRTAGVTTAIAGDVRCLVDQPKQSQIIAGGDLLAGVVARLFVPMPLAFEPAVDGRISYLVDGTSVPRTLQIATATPNVHNDQSHFDLYLRPVR